MAIIGFTGKGVLSSGGASGIGRFTADVFEAHGATVAVNDLDAKRVRDVIRELGNRHVAAPGNVADEDAVIAMVETTKSKPGRIDVLVNYAGVSDTFESTLQQSVEHWQRIMDINLTGTYLPAER